VLAGRPSTIIPLEMNHPPAGDRRDGMRMLHPLFRTLAKVVVASLVVGTILAHFGITAEQLMREVGLSTERIKEYAMQGLAWVWPNVLLGSIVIILTWFVVFYFVHPAKAAATSTGPKNSDLRSQGRTFASHNAAFDDQ
jgi:hypothetical protein